MNAKTLRKLGVTLGILLLLVMPVGATLADGTETLGPPSITIADGSGHVAAGVGLISKAGTIDIDVPTAEIRQVLLYWEGHGDCGSLPLGDNNDCRLGQDITVEGTAVTGQLIGGPTFFYTTGAGNFWSLSYRADLTELGIIAPGANSISLSGVDFDSPTVPGFTNGASLVVIYDDGSTAEIGIRDGNDNAFINFASPLDTTVAQTFNFDPEATDRTANLTLLVGSVKSPEYAGGTDRPTRIVVTVNGTTTNIDNVLASGDGPTWDTVNTPVSIPAGASSLTVQILSTDALNTGFLPASLSWVNGTLSVPVTPTNGAGAGTPGFWMNRPQAWPVEEIEIGGVLYAKQDAIELMKAPGKGDKTYDMFSHLVAAKLNVLSGAESSCINDTIIDADEWMATYGPVGSGVKANDGAWDLGEPLKDTLDDYNNGRLCAPSRDSLE